MLGYLFTNPCGAERVHQGNRKENKHALTPSPLESYSYKYPWVARRSHCPWHGNLSLSLPSTLAGKIMARSQRVRKRFESWRKKSQAENMLSCLSLHNRLLGCSSMERPSSSSSSSSSSCFKNSVYAAVCFLKLERIHFSKLAQSILFCCTHPEKN